MSVITHTPTSCPHGCPHQPLRPLSSTPVGPSAGMFAQRMCCVASCGRNRFPHRVAARRLIFCGRELGPGALSLLSHVSFEECPCLSVLLCFVIQRDRGNHSETSWRGQSWSVSRLGPSCPESLLASPLRHTTGPGERWGCGFFRQFGARSWPPVSSLRKRQSTVTRTKDVGVRWKGAVSEVSWLNLLGCDRGTRR